LADERDRFAMAPESLITGLLPEADSRTRATAFMVYAYLDLRQGEKGRPVQGFRNVARKIGFQERTVAAAARALANAGLIELSESGSNATVMRVLHNPARGRVNENAEVGRTPRRYRHDPTPWNDETETLLRQAQEGVASGARSEPKGVASGATPPRSPRSGLSEEVMARLLPMLGDHEWRCDACLCLANRPSRGVDDSESFCSCEFPDIKEAV
jgi:hypothetical protein